MQALRIQSLDPAYNLALEQCLFDDLKQDDPGWLLIWRNGPSVIVGRHQNTLEEINEAFVREKNIPVIRRETGGGAVYHDEGNLNFSFLTSLKKNERADFAPFMRLMVDALADLNIKAEFTSRNDITVAGRKVSGCAQRRSGEKVLHHGTMLVDLDMSVLGRILTGNPDKYRSKGVSSHRSRVANLREFMAPELDRDTCLAMIADAMIARCADGEALLPTETASRVGELADRKYRTWEWNYGKSPAFTTRIRERFPWGAVDCRFDVQNGIIRACRIFGDFFSSRNVADIENILTGTKFTADDIRAALTRLPYPLEEYFTGAPGEEVAAFLSGETDVHAKES